MTGLACVHPTMWKLGIPAKERISPDSQARVDPNADDALLDEVLGSTTEGARFSASSHLRGDADARASRAFDGDRSSAWETRIGDQRGQWLQLQVDDPITIDELDLEVVADGRHSVPLRVVLEVDGEAVRSIDLPSITDAGVPGASTSVPLEFAPVTGSRFRLVIDALRPVTTTDRDTQRAVALPVSFAEVAVPGVGAPRANPDLATSCRDDLLEVDGRPIGVTIAGTASTAASYGSLELAAWHLWKVRSSIDVNDVTRARDASIRLASIYERLLRLEQESLRGVDAPRR